MLSAGMQPLTTTFTPTDAVDYTMAATTVPIVVNPSVTQIGTPTALTLSVASGNAIVTGSAVQVHGSVQATGNAHISPAPVTGAGTFTDPLAGLAAPSPNGMTSFGAANIAGNSSTTICPGVYTSINVAGNA